MPIRHERRDAAMLLDRCGRDRLVGCFTADGGKLRLADELSPRASGYQLQFGYRNFRARTWVFERTVTVTHGVWQATHQEPLHVPMRPSDAQYPALDLEPACGIVVPTQERVPAVVEVSLDGDHARQLNDGVGITLQSQTN